MALAVVLLAALTGASNHDLTTGAGDGDGQPLAVGIAGIAATDGAAGGTSAKATTTAAAAAAGKATTTVPGGGVTSTAAAAQSTTTVVDGEAAATVDGEAEPEPAYEPEEEPEPSTNVQAVIAEPPPPAPAPAPVLVGLTRLPNVELEVLTLTNMDRGSNGVPPVSRDGCLDAEASAWAHAMAEATTMAHSAGGGGAVQGCRGANAYWGDNIGYWQPCYASEMEAWWMNSPSHRPHILDSNFIAVGIGVWAEPNGRCWFQVYFGS